MNYRNIIASVGKRLDIGIVGENEATRVLFPRLDGYVAVLSILRYGDELPYAVNTNEIGNHVEWIVSSTDVANKGVGKAEVTYYDGDVIVKSDIYLFKVVQGLEPNGETPDPYESWFNDVLRASAEAKTSAEESNASRQESKASEIASKQYRNETEVLRDEVKQIVDDLDVSDIREDLASLEQNKADKSTTYTKAEVDEKISSATPTDYDQVKERVSELEENKADKSEVYNKEEVDTKINNIPTYDDTEIREELGTKADKSTTYNKTEVDNLVAEAEYDDTAIREEISKKADSDTTATKEDLRTLESDKLSKPSSGIEVGKYFRIASIDELGNPILEAVDLPLDDYVKDTDYAGQEKAGVIVGESSYAFLISQSTGKPQAQTRTASSYEGLSNNAFIGKGTLENIKESLVKSVGDAVYQPKEELELIETITLDGTETAITKLAEPNGTPYDFKAVRVYCENVLPQDATANRLLSINCARNSIQLGRMYFDSWKTQGYSILDVFQQRGIWECYRSSASGQSSFNYAIAYGTIASRMRKVADFPTINRIEITFNSVPVSGGKIHIYGVRA